MRHEGYVLAGDGGRQSSGDIREGVWSPREELLGQSQDFCHKCSCFWERGTILSGMENTLHFIPIEILGGPLDGQVISVAHDEPVVVVQTAFGPHRYVWRVEDTGSWFLLYIGAV